MLRTMGVNRSRRGAVRYATFAIVALVGLAAAGLRAPGVDLATSALAQAPSDGAAKTKAAPAAPAERIGLEVVPLDAAYVLSVRPAEIASREESRALTTSFKDLAKLLAESSLSVSDVAEVLVMQYGELDQAPRSNARIVIRFVTPALQKEFLGAFSRKHDLKRSPEDGAWHYEGGRVSKLDASTLVIDQSTTTAGNQPAPLKNAPPEWAGVWQERKEQPVVFAVNVGTAWQSLAGGNADPVAMFGEGAFQTLYPLITDVSWVVADVELKEKIRLSGVFQAKGEESAETVRETLQAAAVLLRNMARLYMKAQPQGPDGNPAPAAQLELQKRLAGEADDLLRSAKFETDGSSVTASFQPTLSTEELAQLIKSVLPSVEEARQAARRQVSMNNLKQLGLAMQNYYAAHSEFPLAAGTKYRVGDEIRTSEHPHSWRVDLLPYLEHLKLYDEYRFDEPWDSDANRKVLAQMPEVFGSPHDEEGDSSNTSYFVFTGPDTVFPGNKAVRMSRIIDGTSKTWMLVEAKRPVPWTKPEDIEYAADKPAPKMEGWVPGSFLAAFVDGHVENMSTDMEEKTLRGFITKAESAGVVTDGAGRYGAESGEPLDFSAPAPTE